MTLPQYPSTGRILELDGLRGFAILYVVLLHYIYSPTGQLSPQLERFRHIFSMGWSGVDLFFVLSGFLIGGILLDARKSPAYFKTFYVRRFFRIIPLYYAWIVCYIALVYVAGGILRTHMRSGLLPAPGFAIYQHFFFLQNLHLKGGELVTLSIWWFGATWSLAVEEQFYLVSPFLVRLLSVRALSVLLTLIVLGAPILRLYVRGRGPESPALAYCLTPCRADTLAIGMLAAVLWRNAACRAWLPNSTESSMAHSEYFSVECW